MPTGKCMHDVHTGVPCAECERMTREAGIKLSKPNVPAELQKMIGTMIRIAQHAMEILQDRKAVAALVRALPSCRFQECDKPATVKLKTTSSPRCDDHSGSGSGSWDAYHYADALRLLLVRMEGWPEL